MAALFGYVEYFLFASWLYLDAKSIQMILNETESAGK